MVTPLPQKNKQIITKIKNNHLNSPILKNNNNKKQLLPNKRKPHNSKRLPLLIIIFNSLAKEEIPLLKIPETTTITHLLQLLMLMLTLLLMLKQPSENLILVLKTTLILQSKSINQLEPLHKAVAIHYK